MAKKKSTSDRHLEPKITLRLMPHLGDFLRSIAETEERTITAVITRALRLYADENGYKWPSVPQDSAKPADDS